MSKNLDLVRACYEAFKRGDIPAVLAAVHPELEFRVAENSVFYRGEPYHGPDELANLIFARLATEWEGFQVLMDRYHDAGDVIVAEGRYAGTYKATGRSFNAQVVHIWTIRDGKLAEFQQYTDTAAGRDATTLSAAATS